MNSFNFGRPVEIEGAVYTISSDRDRIRAALELQQAKLKVIEKSNLPDDRKKKEIAEVCRDGLDVILGKGSFDKIFSERAFNYGDYTMLIKFLTKEMELWKKEENL